MTRANTIDREQELLQSRIKLIGRRATLNDDYSRLNNSGAEKSVLSRFTESIAQIDIERKTVESELAIIRAKRGEKS